MINNMLQLNSRKKQLITTAYVEGPKAAELAYLQLKLGVQKNVNFLILFKSPRGGTYMVTQWGING